MRREELDRLEEIIRALRDVQDKIDHGKRKDWSDLVTNPITDEEEEIGVSQEKQDEMRSERNELLSELKKELEKIDLTEWEED